MVQIHPDSFQVLDDTFPEDFTLPAFMVSTTRGFLPRQDPIVTLPAEFAVLESLLQRLPIKTASGTPGLLATGTLGEAVHKELPNLIDEVEKLKGNLVMLNALYRDYSFLASAYLLEPCHLRFLKDGSYGIGRERLPECISIPIARVAELTGFKPFMEYAGSYALFNYKLIDPTLGLTYTNLSLIRAFEHGLDPTSSEAGFVLVHIDMVKDSGKLVSGVMGALKGCESRERFGFDEGLEGIGGALKRINETMEGMWGRSKPGDYTSFRTFIFGITSQSMFPNGVIYEGVSKEPLSFRGESGANDSMVPLCDNFLQISMPATPLTDILKDFRQYRPGNHREFLEWVKGKANNLGVKEFALKNAHSAELYLVILDQVRDFRWRHWCFTREYILKKTSHPTATGGSPIVRWLPNQLFAVLEAEEKVLSRLRELREEDTEVVEGIRDVVGRQTVKLRKEVEKFCQERGA